MASRPACTPSQNLPPLPRSERERVGCNYIQMSRMLTLLVVKEPFLEYIFLQFLLRARSQDIGACYRDGKQSTVRS